MNKIIKKIIGPVAFISALMFMLFGRPDGSDHVLLKGLLLGAILGAVALVWQLLFKNRQGSIESERKNKQDE